MRLSALRPPSSVIRLPSPVLLLTALLALPALALAQGALTPPATAFSNGISTPTMKSLDQLEPRTPLRAGSPGVTQNANGGFTLSAPGSYYLTGNLTVASGDGIVIDANNVTLDLGGFSISSISPSTDGEGVEIVWPHREITVRNGRIFGVTTLEYGVFTDGGFNAGVFADGFNIDVEDIAVSSVRNSGIVATRIARCSVHLCGWTGLYAKNVIDSRASNCGGNGIYAQTVTNCSGEGVGSNSDGIRASALATNCSGSSQSGGGLIVTGRAENCVGTSDSGVGLGCENAVGCTGTSKSSVGLYASLSATDSSGSSTSGIGLQAGRSAANCHGTTASGAIALRVADDSSSAVSGTATNCFGEAHTNGTGLFADTAVGCKGTSYSGTGLKATSASNCIGRTTSSGVGLDAVTASGSYGESVNNTGLRAGASAENCRGVATGSGYGLYSGGIAIGCTGKTATGNYGIFIVGAASFCRGDNDAASATKFALHAAIAVACTAETGTIEAAQKFQGTP